MIGVVSDFLEWGGLVRLVPSLGLVSSLVL